MTPEERAAFEESGYHVMRNVIDGALLARLQQAAKGILENAKPEWEESVNTGNHPVRYGWSERAQVVLSPHLYDTVFLDVAANETILAAVKATVGPAYQLMVKDTVCHRHPAGTNAHTPWHVDWSPYRTAYLRDLIHGGATTVPAQFPFVIMTKVLLYIEDCDETMGPFAIVPGSNRRGHDAPMQEYGKDEKHESLAGMRKLPGKAGDAIIYDTACWHTGTHNTSTRDRFAYIFPYMPFWVKNWETTTPTQEVIAWANTPYRRQLVGIHSVHERLSMNRTDVEYLPEHLAYNRTKHH
jgi:ectoine hydroxylase-related dioxygenase (phytanoyl-CoA dioxygenase family)